MEISILDAIQSLHTPWLNAVMKFFTFLGNAGWLWIAITVILLILPKTRIWGLTMGTALLLGQVIGCVIMKQLVARPRPYNSPDALVTASQLLIRELKDYSGYSRVLAEMEKKYTDDEIDKLTHLNVLATMRSIIG